MCVDKDYVTVYSSSHVSYIFSHFVNSFRVIKRETSQKHKMACNFRSNLLQYRIPMVLFYSNVVKTAT